MGPHYIDARGGILPIITNQLSIDADLLWPVEKALMWRQTNASGIKNAYQISIPDRSVMSQ